MNLYLDENINDHTLAALLRAAGHTVVQPGDVGLTHTSDPRHLNHAIAHGLVLLTADCDDFEDLHQLILTAGGKHLGILLVRYDNDSARDMKPKHIVGAIGKLERAGLDITSQLIVLNQWR
jgi:predicted nuclease of predicted toxin-antitoxin system